VKRRYYSGPRPERQVVMKHIARLCRRAPRSARYLADATGTSVDSVHVLLHRMRGHGAIVTLNARTAHAVHLWRAPK
jgi:hypothetical protein